MEQPKPRLDKSVPEPEAAQKLTEREKRALELQDEVEHDHGKEKERKVKEAQKLAG